MPKSKVKPKPTPKSKATPTQQVTKFGYIIDSEFEGVFARMTPGQHEELKKIIGRDGFREPVSVWKETNILLDGHNRHRICEDLGITPSIVKVTLRHKDREKAKIWMIQNQFTKRNLNAFQRIEAALQFEPMFAAQAEANKKAGVSLNLAKGVVVAEEIAKLANASPANVKKAKKILKGADDPEVAKALKALRGDGAGVSIHRVYEGIRGTKKTKKAISAIPKPKPKEQVANEIPANWENMTPAEKADYVIALNDKFVETLQDKKERYHLLHQLHQWVNMKKGHKSTYQQK